MEQTCMGDKLHELQEFRENAFKLLSGSNERDKIDSLVMQSVMDMFNRAQLLEQHKFKIAQGSDGSWRTRLPDETKADGRRMVRKSTRKALEDEVVAFYRELEKRNMFKSFDDMYFQWREVQDVFLDDNSIAKYKSDYKRFFENTPFSKMDIRAITEEDVKTFIVKNIKSKKLGQKAAKTLFGYIDNTLHSAKVNKLIADNPMENLRAKDFYKFCTEVKKPVEKKVVSNKDMDRLYERFYEDYQSQPNYIPTYAVHLATLTGMRVGELSALTWDCIFDDHILINKSEKYNRLKKFYFIGPTKNKKSREFPMTQEIRKLLDTVKRVEAEYGYSCEWIFANENGRVHAPVISSCSKNKCRQLGIDEKGIHAYRRTLNSKMRCAGVSSVITSNLLGNSKEVNEEYYSFDVTSMEEKEAIVSKAYQRVS